jgi:hypothetical protein
MLLYRSPKELHMNIHSSKEKDLDYCYQQPA